MSFKFVSFPFCPRDPDSYSIPYPQALFSLCSALSSLSALGNAFPAFRSQPEHYFLRETSWPPPILHIPPTPPLPPHPLSQSCEGSHITFCLFSGYRSQLQFYTFSCRYSIHASVSSSDYRLYEGRKHICFCSLLYPLCLVWGLVVVDSVYYLWDS